MISRKYRYLIALAREKHFGRAAAACHVSPSTLSAAIRGLEEQLGVSLVGRGQRFSGLTPEGNLVVAFAQQSVAHGDNLKQELTSLRGVLTGRLRLGVIPTAATTVAALTSAFCRRHPKVTVEVLAQTNDKILQRLQDFELDAGVVYQSSVIESSFESITLWRERHVLLTAANGPYGSNDTLTWQRAATVPLCLLTSDMKNRQTINEVFSQVGVVAAPIMETNSILSILAHVGSGIWSSILPSSLLSQIGLPPGVVAVELIEPSVEWSTCLVALAREPAPSIIRELQLQVRRMEDVFGKAE